MIDEYSREKAEAETEAEDMMRDKSEGIARSRAEASEKARAEDDMRKQVWRENSLALINSKTDKPRQVGSSLRRKSRSERLNRGPRQK